MAIILHSDLNCFYASVEMNEHPNLRGKKVAVCGSVEDRHGIVLTASYPAKRCGVKTGMAIWQAKQACPDLITVSPHYDQYLRYSRQIRAIYKRYANDVEPFGMDECWISLPYSNDVEGEGKEIAEIFRKTIREETGLTVSVGVSFTKVFAKLGSDMKKPDAVTVVSKGNYKDTAWALPVSDLLYVGPATTRKLNDMCVMTIGDLANTDPNLIHRKLGKNGLMIRAFARGEDNSIVQPSTYVPPVKSVGHGVTCVRDLDNNYEVWLVLLELAQDVGHRLRQHEIRAKGVGLHVRDSELRGFSQQTRLHYPTQSPYELAVAAYDLFKLKYRWERSIRSLTITAILVEREDGPVQTDIFGDYLRHEKRQAVDDAIDGIRARFGYDSIKNASLMGELHMAKDKCETVLMPGIMYR